MEDQYPFFKENFALRKEDIGVFCIDKFEENVLLLEPYEALVLSLSNGQNTGKEICSFIAEGFQIPSDESVNLVSSFYSKYSNLVEMNSTLKTRTRQVDPFQFIYNANPEGISMPTISKMGFPTYSGPLVLVLGLTRECNMFCKYCYKGKPRTGKADLSTEQVMNVIDQAKELGVCRAFVTGGEPTLKNDFIRIVEHIIKCEIFPYISTNALYMSKKIISELRDAKIEFIQVSFDASRADILEDICGVKDAYGRVVANLTEIIKAGINVRTKAVITKKNVDYIEEYVRFCYELGVEHVGFSTFFPGSEGYRNDEELLVPTCMFESLHALTHRLQNEYDGKMFVEEIVLHREWNSKSNISLCGGGVQSIGVFADGNIHICDLLEDSEELSLGNIKEISLKDAWLSEKARRLRNFDPNLAPEPCRSCEIIKYCRTGCYSFSKTCYGNMYSPDPRCPRAPKLSRDYPIIQSSNTDFTH